MYFIIFITLFGRILAEGNYFDRDRITETPRGMANFEPAKAQGKWYMIMINNPCRWAGADKFTDWYQYYSLNAVTGALDGVDVWRKVAVCTRAPFTINMTGPATFTIDDTIGELFTGHGVVVDIDYTSHMITWGCVRPSIVPDVCDEFSFQLKTRSPNPSKSTMQRADAIFDMYWGVKTSDIIPLQHKNPCRFKSEPEYQPPTARTLSAQRVEIPTPFGGGAMGPTSGSRGSAPINRMSWEDLIYSGPRR